jgi:hypothetical protein
MSDDALTPQERAPLLLLMAVAAQVSNNDLKDTYGVTLTGKVNARLKGLKLVETSKVKGHGNTLFHELTDPGWARARQELAGELPTGLWGRSVGLAIAAQLDRYLGRSGLALSDVFVAPDAVPQETPPAADLAARIRDAYWNLAPKPRAWILLTRIREQLAGVSKESVDTVLRKLDREPDVTLAPESNRKSLEAADKAAALEIGSQQMHLIAIEQA